MPSIAASAAWRRLMTPGRRAAGVPHDAAAGTVEEIGGADSLMGRLHLRRRLSGRKDGKRREVRPAVPEEGSADSACRGDDRSIALGELVRQSVDVQMVGTRDAPELLPGHIGHADVGRT